MVCSCTIKAALIVGAVGFFIYRKMFKKPSIKPKPEAYKKDYKKDTVYLYQFKRTRKCPNLSPFCIKVEILCRAYNIPYEVRRKLFNCWITSKMLDMWWQASLVKKRFNSIYWVEWRTYRGHWSHWNAASKAF